MSQVRRLDQIPDAQPLSADDQFPVWQKGRTRIGRVSDLVVAAGTDAATKVVLPTRATLFVDQVSNTSDAAKIAAGNPVGDEIIAQSTTQRSGASTRARRLNVKSLDRPDLRDWADVDFTGANSSLASFRAAIEQTSNAGYSLNVSEGIISLDGNILVPNGLRIQGQGSEIGGGIASAPGRGTWLRIAHSSDAFTFTNAAGRGSIIKGLGLFRMQPAIAGTFLPGDFGWDFNITADDVTIEDVFCQNPTRLLRLSGGAGRLALNRLRGQPLVTGLDFFASLDTNRADNVHFWPFYSSDQKVFDWMLGNADAYVLRRVDNPMLGKLFALGYRSAVRLMNGSGPITGATSKAKIDQLDADYCAASVIVDADVSNSRLDIGMFSTQQPDNYTVPQHSIVMQGANNTLRIHASSFDELQAGALISTAGSGNLTVIDSPRVGTLNKAGTGAVAFNATGTGNRAIITGRVQNTGTTTLAAGAVALPDIVGSVSGTTDASGDLTVTFAKPYGIPPDSVMVNDTAGSILFMQVFSRTATGFKVRYRNASNAIVAGQAVAIDYRAAFGPTL